MADDNVTVDSTEAVAEIKVKSKAGIKRILFDIERKIKVSLSGPRSGRLYRRRGKTKTGKPRFHRASAPGEAPATDTGFLRNSIRAAMDADGLGGTIEIGATYAIWLEEGTRFMEPRPFMRPAIKGALEKARAGGSISQITYA